jgi:hypothetical protein
MDLEYHARPRAATDDGTLGRLRRRAVPPDGPLGGANTIQDGASVTEEEMARLG